MGYIRNQGKVCLTSGCGHKARIRGYCVNCYAKFREKEKKNALKAF